MLTKRIIACLDVSGDRVVKGIQFVDLRDAGDPVQLAGAHARSGADEIVFLDIAATPKGRSTSLDVVRRTAQQLFIPFTVGGGVRSLDDAAAVIEAGADKVGINSAAIATPALITEIAVRFGSQAVVVAIDARRNSSGFDVCASGGRKVTGLKLLEWLAEVESRGAGEILLTSMDRDGSGLGFDCELMAMAASATRLPVIASGGARSVQHFVDVFQTGRADAALAASIFHFGVKSAVDLKRDLAPYGIPVRFPC